MPIDYKRLPVPDSSINPSSLSQLSISGEAFKQGTKFQRPDGRSLNEIRPICFKVKVVSQSQGSAYVEIGNTKVICSVFGPREVKKRDEFSMEGQLYCEFKYATFSCFQRRGHQTDNEEKELSQQLSNSLFSAICIDKYPKSRIELFVMVLENDGNAFAAGLMCASLALVDASIELYDIPVAVSIRFDSENLLVDPKIEEEYTKDDKKLLENGEVLVVYLPGLQQISLVSHVGCLNTETLKQAVKLCIEACIKLQALMEKCITENIKELLQQSPNK